MILLNFPSIGSLLKTFHQGFWILGQRAKIVLSLVEGYGLRCFQYR